MGGAGSSVLRPVFGWGGSREERAGWEVRAGWGERVRVRTACGCDGAEVADMLRDVVVAKGVRAAGKVPDGDDGSRQAKATTTGDAAECEGGGGGGDGSGDSAGGVWVDAEGRVWIDDVVDGGRLSLVHHAAMAGNVSVLRVLVDEFGASVECADADGHTPAFSALLRRKWEALAVLVGDYGARIDARTTIGDATLLHLAAKLSYIDMGRVLGVLVDAVGSPTPVAELAAAATVHGLTPLHVAVLADNVGAIKALLLGVEGLDTAGALVAVDTLRGFTPLHCAVVYGLPARVFEALNATGECGAALDVGDADGFRPHELADAAVDNTARFHYAYDEVLSRGASEPGGAHVGACLAAL